MQERSSAEMHNEPPESRQHFDSWLKECAELRGFTDPPESRQHFDPWLPCFTAEAGFRRVARGGSRARGLGVSCGGEEVYL